MPEIGLSDIAFHLHPDILAVAIGLPFAYWYGIRRLGPLLAARRLRMKADSPSTRLLVHQLQQFPIADHDDGPDALEMAIRLAEELLAGVPPDNLGSRLPVG